MEIARLGITSFYHIRGYKVIYFRREPCKSLQVCKLVQLCYLFRALIRLHPCHPRLIPCLTPCPY